jgi:hypothetical protein
MSEGIMDTFAVNLMPMKSAISKLRVFLGEKLKE